MGLLLFLLASIFIVYNLIINLTNLSKIITYCFETSSVDEYWELFYEACIHRRAIYSSIIIAIFGFIIFIIITPIVLIRSIFVEKKMQSRKDSGAYFHYSDYTTREGQKFFYTNIEELGIDKFESTATGKIAIDFPLIMGYIQKEADNKKMKISQNVLQTYDLKNNISVLVPLIIEYDEKVYPIYLIYDQEHKDSLNKIKPILLENNFQNAIYFSIIGM